MGVVSFLDEHYPGNMVDFDEMFPDEESCRSYLEQVRWPAGFLCPACGCGRGWRVGRGQWFCSACERQTSVTAGTVFEGTRKPLRLWFRVMWLVTSRKSGASALELQRQLGFSRYETVWTWLHKLRRAMVRPDRDRLSGEVEIDETYVGGLEPNVCGRQTEKKSIVVIAAEKDGPRIGRIRMGKVLDVTEKSLLAFIQEAIEPGTKIHTDAWSGYQNLASYGYKHKVSNISRSQMLAHELMPRIHHVASLLKRWWMGTHQGAVSSPHLQYYLDEFTFRFNRRTSKERGKLFFRLVQQAVAVSPATRKQLVARRIAYAQISTTP